MCSLTWREPWGFLSILKVQEASLDSHSGGSIPHGWTSWEPKSSQTVSTDLCHKQSKGAKAPNPRCIREHGCTIEEITRNTNWQSQSSHRRQNSTRSQRTPKAQHREDNSLLSSFALVYPQRPCPRMTLRLDCAKTPVGKLHFTRAVDVGGRWKRSTLRRPTWWHAGKSRGWG